MQVRWQCENDKYASRILEERFPHVPNLGDITQVDWGQVEPVDVLTGGFPCPPFSLAGRRKGGNDDRNMWPEFFRAIRDLKPTYVVIENVPGILSSSAGHCVCAGCVPEGSLCRSCWRPLDDRSTKTRRYFDIILGCLASVGFNAEWDLLPAAAFGAPHLRYRLFLVAYPQRDKVRDEPVTDARSGSPPKFGDYGPSRVVADTNTSGRVWREGEFGEVGVTESADCSDVAYTDSPSGESSWAASKTIFGPGAEPGLRRCREEYGRYWPVESDVCRVVDGLPKRVDRLRCLGNAVVPQVAEFVGRRLVEFHGQ